MKCFPEIKKKNEVGRLSKEHTDHTLKPRKMGNCLKSPTSDDISLPHKSQSDWASFGKGTELDQELLLPYLDQVPVLVSHPTPSQTRLAPQLRGAN